jgi:hypothetical protein
MDTVLVYVTAVNGSLIAIGTLLSGLGVFLRRSESRDGAAPPARRRLGIAAIMIGAVMLTIGAVLFAVRALSIQEPLNVQLTNAAWAAFNKGAHAEAIVAADRCVTEFLGVADREQARLAADKVPSPPVGAVSAAVKATILARGPLNDVATCYWIKGRAAEANGQTAAAREAYLAASKYTYARTWDPQGWFWDPAQDAADRSKRLR